MILILRAHHATHHILPLQKVSIWVLPHTMITLFRPCCFDLQILENVKRRYTRVTTYVTTSQTTSSKETKTTNLIPNVRRTHIKLSHCIISNPSPLQEAQTTSSSMKDWTRRVGCSVAWNMSKTSPCWHVYYFWNACIGASVPIKYSVFTVLISAVCVIVDVALARPSLRMILAIVSRVCQITVWWLRSWAMRERTLEWAPEHRGWILYGFRLLRH